MTSEVEAVAIKSAATGTPVERAASLAIASLVLGAHAEDDDEVLFSPGRLIVEDAALSTPMAASDDTDTESVLSTLVEDGDAGEERASMRSLSSWTNESATDKDSRSSLLRRPSLTLPSAASISALKIKTQQAATQQRDALARFQKKGGIVGWLHGDAGTSTDSPVEEEMATRPQTIATAERSSVSARPRASSLMNTLFDKMKKPGRDKRHNSSSEENKRRVSLQPRRSATDASRSSVGFDDFVGTSQGGGTRHFRRDSRLRLASSSDAVASDASVLALGRLRSLSFATRTPAAEPPTSSPSTSSGLQMDAFPMEECLADPKLAAEFINAVLPGDEWLLALLYSIEEYECMLTTDPLPSLETQITTTMAIIDRFLTPTTPRPQYDALEIMGKELKHVVTQFQLPEHTSGGSLPTVLPKILFDSVYTTVYDILRDAYDSQFRAAWEYRQLLSEANKQMRWQREGQQLLVLTFDQVLESEWCCTVFWVYLFRTSHHYRLSFIMDIKYKLRRLWSATQDLPSGSTEAKEAYKRLVHELELLCHRYLSSKMASVALPMTSALLTKLKDEICGDIRELRLCSKSSGNLDLIRRLSRIIEKLDTMHTQTRAEFKRVSLERFTNFLASSLYRDFILHPISSSSMDCSRSEDLMQLLRVNRIPFHQTPAMPPNPPTLTHLLADLGPDHCEGAFHHGIAGLFAFQGIRLATLTGSEGVVRPRSSRLEYRHWYSSPDETEATRLTLCKSSEHFLLPETTPASFSLEEACRWPPVCFNFLSGTGDKTVYGAVWRFGAEGSDTEDSTRAIQGVCVLSRFPLVDSLREILKEIASSIQPGSDLFAVGQDHTAGLVKMAQSAFSMNLAHFSIPEEPQRLPPIDFSLQDLFECLSITHIMRLFAFVLQEKKLVLVSSSYSVLFSVGTALQTLLSPLLWTHVYVPVLPMGMKCYLHCPTPFIFGLHTSYARHCELPKPSDDLVVVNLDRDSLTGGGDVALPPLRANSLREKLVRACKPRLQARDQVAYAPKDWEVPLKFPSVLVRRAFREELDDILRHLETFAFRFECSDRLISVVDTSNKSRQWPVDTARFYTAILQSQAFSTYVGSSLS